MIQRSIDSDFAGQPHITALVELLGVRISTIPVCANADVLPAYGGDSIGHVVVAYTGSHYVAGMAPERRGPSGGSA